MNFNDLSKISCLSWNVNGLVSRHRFGGRFVKKFETLMYILKVYDWPDLVFLQETHLMDPYKKHVWETKLNNYRCFFNYGEFESKGTAILIKNTIHFEIKDVNQDIQGNFTIIKGDLFGERITLASIYAPSRNGERGLFFEKLFEQHTEGIHLFLGDFNSVFDKNKDRSHPRARSNPELVNYALSMDFVDIWRDLNPTKTEFSYEGFGQNPRSSRIDLCLVSRIAKTIVSSMEYEDQYDCSDHKLFTCTLKFENKFLGHDFKKFKPHYFTDNRFTDMFKIFWEGCISDFRLQIEQKIENDQFQGDPQETLNIIMDDFDVSKEPLISNLTLDKNWWESFKDKIRYLAKKFERLYENKDKKEIEKARIDYLNSQPGDQRERLGKLLQKKIVDMRNKEFYKIKIEEKLGKERCHANFFKLIRKSYNNNFISLFEDEDGTVLNQREEIQACLTRQYSDLYDLRRSHGDFLNQFLTNLPQVQNENINPFSLEECKKAISDMEPNKCPGLDGIRIEFYKKHIKFFGPFFIKMVNNCVENGEFPESWNLSAIQLIPKTNEEIPSFKNMRPLSILNNDYKIVGKMGSNRIKPLLPGIINKNQTGGVAGRQVQKNTLLIHLLIQYYTQTNRSGFIISLDNRKAYDLVIREYLWAVMRAFGFSNRLVSILKLLYMNNKSSILLNGFISPFFTVKGGVKQGCPLSAMLYTIFIEPLAIALNNAQYIHGLTLPNRAQVKLLQHSDDMTLMLATRWSADLAMGLISRYGLLSGCEINHQKSFAIHLTPNENRRDNNIAGIRILGPFECKKILGIFFAHNVSLYVKKNWSYCIEKSRKALELWKSEYLSLVGRTLVINTMVISRFVYMLQTIEFSKNKAKNIDKIIGKFLWPKKPAFRALKYCKWPHVRGGLGITDLWDKAVSLQTNNIKSFLDREEGSDSISDPRISILRFYLDSIINDTRIHNLPRIENSRTALNYRQIKEKHEFPWFFYNCILETLILDNLHPRENVLNKSTRSMLHFREIVRAEVQHQTGKYPPEIRNLEKSEQKLIWDAIFYIQLETKIQSFNFLLAYKILPTTARMYQQQLNMANSKVHNPWCVLCLAHGDNIHVWESVEHLFLRCPVALFAWERVNSALRLMGSNEIDINIDVIRFRKELRSFENKIVSEVCFAIWKNRCNQYYDNAGGDGWEICSLVRISLCCNSEIDRGILTTKKYHACWGKINRWLEKFN